MTAKCKIVFGLMFRCTLNKPRVVKINLEPATITCLTGIYIYRERERFWPVKPHNLMQAATLIYIETFC